MRSLEIKEDDDRILETIKNFKLDIEQDQETDKEVIGHIIEMVQETDTDQKTDTKAIEIDKVTGTGVIEMEIVTATGTGVIEVEIVIAPIRKEKEGLDHMKQEDKMLNQEDHDLIVVEDSIHQTNVRIVDPNQDIQIKKKQKDLKVKIRVRKICLEVNQNNNSKMKNNRREALVQVDILVGKN